MPVDRRLRLLGSLVITSIALLTSGCGLAAGLLVGVITDAINGDNDDGGDPTILLVGNADASVDAIVRIEVARVDGTHAPYGYDVDTAAGGAAALKNVFDAGPHWVRVVYASGWRSRARSIDVVKDATVSTSFLHGAPVIAPLAGTWFGAAQTSTGTSLTYAFTLDAAGNASARTTDGVVDAATGTLAETSEGVYRVSWSGATVAALVTDEAQGHAGLVTDDGTVGALQKGAVAPLPVGTDADVVGTWVGTQVRLVGAPLAPADLDAASATVSGQQHWVGSDGDGDGTIGVSPLTVTAPAFLWFEADAEDDAPVPAALAIGMCLTADRAFGFVVLAPAAGGTFPDAGAFQLLEKSP